MAKVKRNETYIERWKEPFQGLWDLSLGSAVGVERSQPAEMRLTPTLEPLVLAGEVGALDWNCWIHLENLSSQIGR